MTASGLHAFRPGVFAGKVAFITGGTSGINLSIAQGLASLGAQVTILGRNREKANAAAETISVLGPSPLALTADVRDYAAMEAAVSDAVSAFGGLDFVIAGAAGNFIAGADGLSPNGFKAVVDIDLMGTFHTFKAARPHLRAPGASLIAISAGQATRASWGQAHAASAKAGVEALIKALALEWGADGVRVNGLTPGPIAGTEGVDRLIPAEIQVRMAADLPARRFGRADEMAAAAAFLLSDAASYVTGAMLVADGGLALASASYR